MTGPHAKDIGVLRGVLMGREVFLRPFSVSDLTQAYLDWMQDAEVVRFSNQRFRAHTAATCRSYLDSFSGSSDHFLAICHKVTGAMVGTMTVYRNVPHGTADIGIMIGDRGVWGQGIGSDAFCTAMDALLCSGAVRKVTAGTVVLNTGMVRIMEKAGMQHDGTRRAQEVIDGVPVDIVYYARFSHL